MILTVFLCTIVMGLLAHWHVRRTYARHNRVPTLSGYTGAEAASDILAQAGIHNVTIVEHDEFLGTTTTRHISGWFCHQQTTAGRHRLPWELRLMNVAMRFNTGWLMVRWK